MKRACIILICILCVLNASGCKEGGVRYEGLNYENVPLEFGGVELTAISPPAVINSRQDLSDFMDWCVFYPAEETRFAPVGEEYKRALRSDFVRENMWAGQNGALSHNFWTVADVSELDKDIVGVRAMSFPYGFRVNPAEENDVNALNYEYYSGVIENGSDRGFTVKDFALYKDNKGFTKVSDGDGLFYAVQSGYMPVPEEGSAAADILTKALGILNRILTEDMNDLNKLINIYNYLVCETAYDYKAAENGEYEHYEFAAYFPEGVFCHNSVVCDGLAKSLVILCGLLCKNIQAF